MRFLTTMIGWLTMSKKTSKKQSAHSFPLIMVVSTRRRSKFEDCVSRAMDLARRRNITGAVALFTSEVNQSKPFDYLLLHTAAEVSLNEFEKCLRLYHDSNSMANDSGMK